MEILNNNHQKTVIATITKIYNYSRINGKLNSKELYLLNMIYGILNHGCLNNEQLNKLVNLYSKILNSSNILCKFSNIKNYIYNPNPSFHIGIINTPPEIDNPDPVDPPIEPDPIFIKICDIIDSQITASMDFLKIDGQPINKCLEVNENINSFNILKILSLPENGILQYNNINVIENQEIPYPFIQDFIYTTFLERGNDEFDLFKFQLIETTTPIKISNEVTYNIRVR